MQHFIYEWTNTRNGKMYIGSHSGSVDDGYIGSGFYFKRAYLKEPEVFERRIVEFFDTRVELLENESRMLKELNCGSDEKFYNISESGCGGYDVHSARSPEEKRNMHTSQGIALSKTILSYDEDRKADIKLKKQKSWAISPKRLAHVERTRERRLREELSITEEEKLSRQIRSREAYFNRSPDAIEEHRRNISKSVKKSYTEELRSVRSATFSKANKGTRYMKKDNSCKRVHPEDIQMMLESGWTFGMIKKNPSSSSPLQPSENR